MGVYLPDLYPIKKFTGEPVLELLIEQSFKKKSVFFKICKDNNCCRIYWNFEIPIEELFRLAEEFERNRSGERAKMEHIIYDEQFKEELGLRNQIYEGILTEEETDMVLQFAEHGLSNLTEPKWGGLDGHHYEIKILQRGISYECWYVLPKQWKELGQMIDICIEKAKLDADVYGYDIRD